jgi:hypothetical protein
VGPLDPGRGGQTAKRHPDFAAGYQAIARRRGKKIATTAIARRLLTRAYHLLTDASPATTPPAPHPAISAPVTDAPTDREGRQAPGKLAFRMSRPRRAR